MENAEGGRESWWATQETAKRDRQWGAGEPRQPERRKGDQGAERESEGRHDGAHFLIIYYHHL